MKANVFKALAAASLCAILSAPAQADNERITFTMSGVVDQGRDDLNLFFGAPGDVAFLSGEAYTLSLAFDAGDLALRSTGSGVYSYQGDPVDLTGTLTMNGKSLTWTTTTGLAAVAFTLQSDFPEPGDPQGVRLATDAAAGDGTDGLTINAVHDARTHFWQLLTGGDLTQAITFPARLQDTVATSHFDATGAGPHGQLTTWFDGQATSASWTVSPVPEPGQYALLACGLAVAGVFGVAGRGRKA